MKMLRSVPLGTQPRPAKVRINGAQAESTSASVLDAQGCLVLIFLTAASKEVHEACTHFLHARPNRCSSLLSTHKGVCPKQSSADEHF
jgi:hypothetical protein